ncbi:MAG: hypothetical protein AB2421_19425 [Thermotaleaceae bacterium]
MKIKARKITISVMFFMLVLGLWINGIIPQQIGKAAAINYVQKNHEDRGLLFVTMEYSSVHGDYFAVFKDSNGEVYNFLMHSKLLPITVLYDPLNLPE